MSKMKRKWLRVIEYEENGTPLDDLTRAQLEETHPDLPLLHQPTASMVPPQAQMHALPTDVDVSVSVQMHAAQAQAQAMQDALQAQMGASQMDDGLESQLQGDLNVVGPGPHGLQPV